jgi:hypothetical protein
MMYVSSGSAGSRCKWWVMTDACYLVNLILYDPGTRLLACVAALLLIGFVEPAIDLLAALERRAAIG